jgi:hypothetical protein
MKSSKQTPETAQIDVATAVTHAVESAPSRALLIAAKAKLDSLTAKATAESQEIERLKTDPDKNSHAGRVKDALDGKPIAEEANYDLVKAATVRLEAFQGAIDIQTKVIYKLKSDLFYQVITALKSIRQPLVTRLAAALEELRIVSEEDAQIRRAMGQYDITAPVIPGVGEIGSVTLHPAMRGIVSEESWRAHEGARLHGLNDISWDERS